MTKGLFERRPITQALAWVIHTTRIVRHEVNAEGSLGPRARAARILRDAAAIMTEGPQDVTALGAWRLRIEGIAREIDASFTPDTIPAELAALRARIVETLAPNPAAGPQ